MIRGLLFIWKTIFKRFLKHKVYSLNYALNKINKANTERFQKQLILSDGRAMRHKILLSFYMKSKNETQRPFTHPKGNAFDEKLIENFSITN